MEDDKGNASSSAIKAKRTHSKTATTSPAVASGAEVAAAAAGIAPPSSSPGSPGDEGAQSSSAAAASAAARRVSGNPAARKRRQFGGGVVGVAADTSSIASAGMGSIDAAPDVEARSSLLSWTANVTDDVDWTDGSTDRNNSLMTVTSSSSGTMGNAGGSMTGGSTEDMRRAADQASRYLASLPPEERGSITLPPGTAASSTARPESARVTQNQEQSGADRRGNADGSDDRRRQSRFSNVATALHNINEVGAKPAGDTAAAAAAAQRSSLSSLPSAEEDLRLSSLSMEGLMTELEEVDGDHQSELQQPAQQQTTLRREVTDQQSNVTIQQGRGGGRPLLERENTERTMNTGNGNSGRINPNDSDMTLNTTNMGLGNLSKAIEGNALGENAVETNNTMVSTSAANGSPITTRTYSLPLTLAPPPPPSPLAVIAAGLPSLIRHASAGSVASTSAAASRNRHYAKFEQGVNKIVSYTLAATMRYLEEHFPNAELTCRDLMPSPYSWSIKPRIRTLTKGHMGEDSSIPAFLRSAGFRYGYERRCDHMLIPGTASAPPSWWDNVTAMASFSLLYCSKYPIALSPSDSDSAHQESLLLYGFVAEHRAHVPHFSRFDNAVTEEINMATQVAAMNGGAPFDSKKPEDDVVEPLSVLLSDGGAGMFSAPLIDDRSDRKYCLRIQSGVTGYTYTFYGETIDESAVPTQIGGAVGPSRRIPSVSVRPGTNPGLGADGATDFYGLGRGIARVGLLLKDDGSFEAEEGYSLPSTVSVSVSSKKAFNPENDPHRVIARSFRLLNPVLLSQGNDVTGFGTASKHQLLLQPKEVGRIYVNGQYITTFGEDETIPSTAALFGYDLLNIPVSRHSGRLLIADYNAVYRAVGVLIQECLIDGLQGKKEMGAKILKRLIHGQDSLVASDEYTVKETNSTHKCVNGRCLESEVMSSTSYDPVGISAKALTTQFALMYGKEGFPCLSCDERYVKDRLGGHRVPVVVPERVLHVLRRGGLFDISTTEDYVWFANPEAHYSIGALDPSNAFLIQAALEKVNNALIKVGDNTIDSSNVLLVRSSHLFGGVTPVFSHSFMCRRNRKNGKYYLNDSIFSSFNEQDEQEKIRLIGLYIVQQHHSNDKVLIQYLGNDA